MENKRQGLTSHEVTALLASQGYNELPASKKKSLWALALVIVREPMVLLLLAGAIIYFLLGEAQDSVLLLLSVGVIVGIAIYQEHRSTRALEALKDLSSPRALVLRDEKEQRVAARELVPGDLLIIKEGDRIAADCHVVEATNLEVDESLLSGESQPVPKQVGRDSLFSSTLVTSGYGAARIFATGIHTEVGKIGKSLEVEDDNKTRLQQEIALLVRRFGTLGLVFSFIVTLAYGFTRGDWPQGVLAGIAAAMSLLPEEFPVILTVFLALGAWRLSKKQVLVRQTAATENLGGVTVLCVDKTGTLTQNQMAVKHIRTPERSYSFQEDSAEEVPPEFQVLLEYAALASPKDPFDPMEKAILRVHGPHPDWELQKEYPLTPNLLAMSRVWKPSSEEGLVIATKGAPETVLELCRLQGADATRVHRQIEEMSAAGYRVLGVARARAPEKKLPENQRDFLFQFVGLLGFMDPLRPGVVESVEDCIAASIRVIMITGDHPGTACKIAADIGLPSSQEFLTGADLEKMDELELQRKIKSVNVFARMVPVQKLRIVNALRASKEVVAMTGDGVNDAPSLKWADIGLAMGGRGTDVAREAADLVILDDDFTSIVAAIRLGRRIFANIRRAMSFIFAVHFPIAALAITPVLFGWPLFLFPAHIVFLELIIDPACTLIFEAEDEDAQTMTRPPRKLDQALFGYRDIFLSSVQGLMVFLVISALFVGALQGGLGEHRSRTLAFIAFVFSNMGLIVINEAALAFLKNKFFWIVFSGTVLLLIAILATPVLRQIYGFSVPHFTDVFLALLAAVGASLLSKILQKRRKEA